MPDELKKSYVAILDGLQAFPFDILKLFAIQEQAENLLSKDSTLLTLLNTMNFKKRVYLF